MSFFGATQDYYPRNTELGSVMSKADTQLFLRPTPNSNSVVASELHYGKGDMSRFDLMKRGDCIIKGNFYSKEQKRNIPATICGKVDSYPKIPDNYCGNTLQNLLAPPGAVILQYYYNIIRRINQEETVKMKGDEMNEKTKKNTPLQTYMV